MKEYHLYSSKEAQGLERPAMSTVSIKHLAYSPNISFEDFTANFPKLCGTHDIKAYQNLLNSPAQKGSMEGPSGFMIFATYDHGTLLNIKNALRKAKQYVVISNQNFMWNTIYRQRISVNFKTLKLMSWLKNSMRNSINSLKKRLITNP